MTDTALRPCRVCGEDDPEKMARDRTKATGLDTICRACAAAKFAAYRARNLERVRAVERQSHSADQSRRAATLQRQRNAARTPSEVEADRARLRPDGLKRCREDGAWLPLSAFNAKRDTRDGLQQSCRDCYRRRKTARRRERVRRHWTALGLNPDRCLYCGAPSEHADHVHPRHLDGPDVVENLAPACAPCNLGKSARPVVWWVLDRFGDEAATVLDRLLSSGLDVASPASSL